MFKKATVILLVLVAVSAMMAIPALADEPFHKNADVTIYVTSQDLYYDSIIGPALPPHGRFQKLEMGPDGPYTEFGPGDQEFVGGRWWVDTNGNNEMDDSDTYFSCPLLGPGRTSP